MGLRPWYSVWVFARGILCGSSPEVFYVGLRPRYSMWVFARGLLCGSSPEVFYVGLRPRSSVWGLFIDYKGYFIG
jgi:hypothetical protein